MSFVDNYSLNTLLDSLVPHDLAIPKHLWMCENYLTTLSKVRAGISQSGTGFHDADICISHQLFHFILHQGI